MCVGQSLDQLAGEEPVAVTWGTGAAYRVLRGGRQRPPRSVDREAAGRNESEAIEPRQIFGVWMPSKYEAAKATSSKGPGPERIHRGPSARHVSKADPETQEIHEWPVRTTELLHQGPKPKIKGAIPLGEVRCSRSSKEVE